MMSTAVATALFIDRRMMCSDNDGYNNSENQSGEEEEARGTTTRS